MRRLLGRRFLGISLTVLTAVAACTVAPGSGQKYVVFFTEFSAQIDAPAKQVIADAAAAANKSTLPVHVTGYADPIGSPTANTELSRLRAQLVYDSLVADGVAASRITRDARGPQSQPGVESRRVEIAIGG